MEVSHSFRFRWNDHVPHLSQIFTELRYDEVYCDTTLISDDGYVLKAHGAVLSVTSRYFERILCDVTSDQHPIIVLKGANFMELSCLLDYIYQGVTQVDQHLMEAVLDVADMLEIKGLSKMKNNLSIKKLIAPSPPSSAAMSRGSAQSSSPSKSPSPTSQSPSCSSSPIDNYASSSMLKVDAEDINDLSELSAKSKHSYSDGNTQLRTTECQDYAPNTSKYSICQNNEFLDQTLGIDLSLSRATNEESERVASNNFHLYEDPALRKRKVMVEEAVPHKKKKLFRRPVTQIKNSPLRSQDENHSPSTSHFTLEKLASMLSREKTECKPLHEGTCEAKPAHKHKPKLPLSGLEEEQQTDSQMDSQVEVLCHEGALTISVTTDTTHQRPLKNVNSAPVSLFFKKGKKKFRNKRQVESLKREPISGPKKAFSRVVLKRPNTRFFKRLKADDIDANEPRPESVSAHCDLSFHSSESSQQKKDKPSSHTYIMEENKVDQTRDNGSQSDEEASSSKTYGKEGEERKGGKLLCISPSTLLTLPPVKEREKQTRTSLTLQEKIKVIEAFLDGKSQRQIAHLYGIGKTQVNGIVKKREEILSLYRESLVRGEKLTVKRQRKSEYASLNEHLIKWYRHMTVVAGMKITTGMLRAKALQIAPQLGYHDFKASNGWLATFKANHNLKFSRAKKPSEGFSSEHYEETETQKDNEFFEEVEEPSHMSSSIPAHVTSSSSSATSSEGVVNVHPVGLHLGSMRSDPDSESTTHSQPAPMGVTIGNSILSSSGGLPKPPQMSNMALGTNIAYNLTREHPRSDLTHLSDLHSASTVNAPPSLAHPPHPTLAKPPEGPLSYKTEDSISYGYDTQGRMNEGTGRSTEYNYTHYGFPSTYYGYHFLGQY